MYDHRTPRASEDIVGVLAQTPADAREIVAPRVDGPDDVAERIDEAAGAVGDVHEAPCRLMAERGRFPTRHFALDGDARQAAADVVVQIGGDAHAHALEGEQARHAVPVRGERGQDRRGEQGGPEPPPLRHRRQDANSTAAGPRPASPALVTART